LGNVDPKNFHYLQKFEPAKIRTFRE